MKLAAVSKDGLNGDQIYLEAARRIRDGKLVAFPTETVYGLGAYGLDEEAVKRIYAMKRRPADDPVILHVTSVEQAWPLWQIDENMRRRIDAIQKRFWPGPLTIIAPATSCVPPLVTANTMKVSVRNPSHPVARRLIDEAGVPIAAPSANLFSRISPTKAQHVAKYFNDEDLLILECDDCCSIGIESTVIMVDDEKIRILRSGAVTASALQQAVDEAKCSCPVIDRNVLNRLNKERGSAESSSPGQSLIHYAPTTDTFLAVGDGILLKGPEELQETAIIDLSGHCRSLADHACFYCDLSGPNCAAASHRLFSTFHEIEDNVKAKRLIICVSKDDSVREEYAGLIDRSLRAAAHRLI